MSARLTASAAPRLGAPRRVLRGPGDRSSRSASARAASSAGAEVEPRARPRPAAPPARATQRARGARVVERQHRRVRASAAPRRRRPWCRARGRRRRSCRSCRRLVCHHHGKARAADQPLHRARELGVLLRQPRERHERRGHAGAPERLVAGPREAPARGSRWPVTSATTVSAKRCASSVACSTE